MCSVLQRENAQSMSFSMDPIQNLYQMTVETFSVEYLFLDPNA